MDLVSIALDYDDGFETGIQLMVEAVLLSPYFLDRVESATDADTPRGRPLDS